MVRLTGRQATNYLGVQASSPPDFSVHNRPPRTTDWQNFYLGDLWEVSNPNIAQDLFVYILVSLRNNIATWVRFTGGNGDLISLTSNTGGPVFADGTGNINTIGDGTTITGVGNPGTNTITFSVIGGMAANTFIASAVTTPTGLGGTATPTLGVINVQSNHNLNISAGLPNTGASNDLVYWTTNTSTWGDLVNVTAGNFSVQAFTGDITITANNGIGNFNLPTTTSSGNAGVITQGGTGFSNRRFHTFGSNNIFIGPLSGNNTLSGSGNISMGVQSLNALTSGSANVGLGFGSLASTNTGVSNTAVGAQSLTGNIGGYENVAIGTAAMITVPSGFQNVAVGVQALQLLEDGFLNTCVGHNAGNAYSSTESNNIIIGFYGGSIGEQNNIRMTTNVNTGDLNIFIGQNQPGATFTIGAGMRNTGVGSDSFKAITTGVGNTGIGNVTLKALTTGSANTSIGIGSLERITSGSSNIAIGQNSGLNYTTSESYNILMGHQGVISESNTIRIGVATGSGTNQQNRFFAYGVRGITTGVNDAIAVLIDSAGQLGTVSSSRRYKENINPIGDISEKLYQLNPVQFNYKQGIEQELSPQNVNYGLIAEEVKEIMPRLVVHDQFGEVETVRYDQLIPLLLNEIIKLNNRIKYLELKNT